MVPIMPQDVTQLLNKIESGDSEAAEELLPIVYEELRHLAAHKMSHEKPGQQRLSTKPGSGSPGRIKNGKIGRTPERWRVIVDRLLLPGGYDPQSILLNLTHTTVTRQADRMRLWTETVLNWPNVRNCSSISDWTFTALKVIF